MKKATSALFALILMMIFMVPPASGQEWTEDQREVWVTVENNWAAWAEGRIDDLAAGVHDGYLGWNTESPLPSGKSRMIKSFKKSLEKMKVVDYDLIPARIVVTGDAAVVHYFWGAAMSYGEDKMEKIEGRYVEFYVKDGKKWLLLGDFTTFGDEDDD